MLAWHSLIWPHISHRQDFWFWGEPQKHGMKSLESEGSQPGQLDPSWQGLSQNGHRAEQDRDSRPLSIGILED